jgi:epoxyqueuosine reductase QueG
MARQDVPLWGAADLRAFQVPSGPDGLGFPRAISYLIPLGPAIMGEIRRGPTPAYAREYLNVNGRLQAIGEALCEEIQARGYRAMLLAPSARTDPAGIKGDFPHKTAATRAGLGWIGRNCQLVTRVFGPWVRLGTVFTDLDLSCGRPVDGHACGKCTLCVDACPARALSGNGWQAGVPREHLLDARACDLWKKANYQEFNHGHNCGICAAVCPYGLRLLKGLV